jgi:hypothetical protein
MSLGEQSSDLQGQHPCFVWGDLLGREEDRRRPDPRLIKAKPRYGGASRPSNEGCLLEDVRVPPM